MGWAEEDFMYDLEQARDRVIKNYKKLQKRDPNNQLLQFFKIKTRGCWIFKIEEVKIVAEFEDEYLSKYSPPKETTPWSLGLDSYASDFEKDLQEK